MAKELNEDTGFKVSIKTLIGLAFAIATVVGMWFALQADIQEARELPVPPDPEVTRMEYDNTRRCHRVERGYRSNRREN